MLSVLGRVVVGVAVGLILAAAPAQAAWYRAETDRFVVYGEGAENRVRDYALKLNTFDWVLRLYHPETMDRRPETKLTVYLVDSRADLQRAAPGLPPRIVGFYTATPQTIFAIAVRDDGPGGDDTLFHEYAHHFMRENFPVAYPAWFVEGFAEYFMTTEITTRSVKIGGYNPGRVYEMFNSKWLPLEDVLSKTTWETRPEQRGVYYAQAWLLMHFMRSTAERGRQLDVATAAIADGAPPVKALERATGMSMAQLTEALHGYRKLSVLTLQGERKGVDTKVTVSRAPSSADDLLLDSLRLLQRPAGRIDAELLAQIRRKAAKYPGDALAEATLARAEFLMGDVAAGEAIVQRRLAAAPDDAQTLLLAGLGQLFAGMRDPANREARYRAARPLLIKAYQIDKTDFRILSAYSLSRALEPGFPNDNDISALLEARALAPSVMETSFRTGMALLRKGRRDEAAKVLAPVINDPHGGQMATRARQMLNQDRIGFVNIEPPQDDPPEPPPQKKPAA